MGRGFNRHGFNAGWDPGIVSSWAQCRVSWSIMLSVPWKSCGDASRAKVKFNGLRTT
jgi:hypothetical protein